jgi:hypothetical protein
VALRRQLAPEHVDKGRFADARHARDPDPDAAPSPSDDRVEEAASRGAIVGPLRFDEGDGAGQRRAVAP